MPLPRLSVLLTILWVASALSADAQAPTPAQPLNVPPPLPVAPTPIPNAPGLVGRGSEPSLNPPLTGNPVAPAPTPPERADLRLDFPNAPIADVLRYYESYSGKHVIYDTSVQGTINLSVNNITRSQAVHIIEMSLNLNGFSLVPADDNVVKVVGLGKPVRPVGVPIYFDVKDVPDNEQVATLLVRLNFLEPQETQGILAQYIPPSGTVGFIALQKAGELLLTDTGRSLRRLYTLIQQIDVSPLSVEDRFFKLERADVTKAVEFLNSVFETKGGGTTGSPGIAAIPGSQPTVRRPIRRVGEDGTAIDPAALAGQAGGLGGNPVGTDKLIVGPITLTPDIRTNRVHVVTNRRNMLVVQRLLQEFDADTEFATPVRYPLRYVRAKDVLPILVQTLTEPGTEGGANGTGTGSTPGATNPNRNGSNSNSNNLFNNLNSNNGSSGSSGSGSSSNLGSEGLDTQPIDTTPTIVAVGNNKLIADQGSNTIIVSGGADANDKVAKVIQQLDVFAPQVVIRTVIGELSLGDDREFGLKYLLRSRRGTLLSDFQQAQITGTSTTDTTGTTTGTGTGTSTTTTSTLNSLATLATGLGSSFSGVGGVIAVGKSFDIILSALESSTRFKTVSRPMIFTQNNQKAIIASGQEIAVPTSQVGSSNGTVGGTVGTYTNVEYKNVTLQLEVVPLINSNKEITLDILQKIDSVVAGGGTVVNGTRVPTIATRYLKSKISAPNDSTIVLGGLITQDENHENDNIPYLSRIPLLGKLLFSTRTRDATRSELVILLHPEVLGNQALLAGLRDREEDRTYLGPKLEDQLRPLVVKKAIPVTTTTTVRTKKTTTVAPYGK